MAYPVIESTFTGREIGSDIYHRITNLPSGTTAGEAIIVFFSVYPDQDVYNTYISSEEAPYTYAYYTFFEPETTSNWVYFQTDFGTTSLVNQVYYAVCLSNGPGADSLNIITRYVTYTSNFAWRKAHYPCRLSWVGYVISGHGIDTSNLYRTVQKKRTYYLGTNWQLDALTVNGAEYEVLDDYLWLIASSSQQDSIATAQPSGYSSLITAQGLALDDATSISSCYKNDNTIYNHPATSFVTAPLNTSNSIMLRIAPGIITEPSEVTGFWIKVPKDSIGIQ